MKKKEEQRKYRRDKAGRQRFIIRIVAIILALLMILSVGITAVYYIIANLKG